MSQTIVDYSESPSGAELLDDMLSKEQENLLSSHSGTERPSYAIAGTKWLDISVTPWLLKIYDGTDDIVIGTVNPTTNEFISTHPLTNAGDLFVLGTSAKPARLPSSSVVDSVLTSNGANALPSYKKPPIAILEYSVSRTYSINDLTVSVGDTGVTLYRSKVNNNTGNALSNTTYWEGYKLGGVWGAITGTLSQQLDLQQALNNASRAFIPTGLILPYGGTTAPNGFLMCDGTAVSRTTYADLFSVIGTAFGSGDGSTTFNLPDYRDRTLFMRNDKAVGRTSLGSIPDHRHQSWGTPGGTGWSGGGANNGEYNTTYASEDTSLFSTSLYSKTVNKVIPSHASCNFIIKY